MRLNRGVAAAVALLSGAGVLLLMLTFGATGAEPPEAAGRMTSSSVEVTGAINVVAAILLDFRAFDTLGEASVIFASVAGVGVLFRGSKQRPSEPGLGLIVRRSVASLSSLFFLFPLYIILHGHLSPGGGFQGGVSLAVLLILLTVVYGTRLTTGAFGPAKLHATESLSALAFLLVGLAGVLQGTSYLANLAAGFPRGNPGTLLSAGAIPLLNGVIGVKVASGLGSIFFDLLSVRGD